MKLTPRLILRPFAPSDSEPFARMNADGSVMTYLPSVLTREQSDAMLERITLHHTTHGFGWMAAELRDTGEFVGAIGLSVPTFEAHFCPCVEIGWRLADAFWNKGLATEGARHLLEDGFTNLGLQEIVSFTVPNNLASRRVMEKIGMHRDEREDFDHPKLEVGHPLRRHVLYRIRGLQD